MDVTNVVVGGAIIGLVNGVTKQFPQVNGILAWVLAVGLGAVAGLLGLEGLTLQTGIILGLASSGVYKISQNIAGN